jgi:NAD(P)-dependent dehydrogenase (short-subunit alcohol dehydrogenase family)
MKERRHESFVAFSVKASRCGVERARNRSASREVFLAHAHEEVAAAVLSLCSDAARFTIGSTLSVDGGWVAL